MNDNNNNNNNNEEPVIVPKEHKHRFHFKNLIQDELLPRMKYEKDSKNTNQAILTNRSEIYGFSKTNKTGVIYVMSKARELGYSYDNEEWANFGQGAPETGEIEGQPERNIPITLSPSINEYAPVAGITELRQKIADLYNARYRVGKESQYTYENVCVCPGGRASLSRLAACIGNSNVSYMLPDYTAYEQMLSVFKQFVPIPNALDHTTNYKITADLLKSEIKNRGISVVLWSNPGNPTGSLLEGNDLKEVVDTARNYHCSIIFDEFYSHYVYTHPEEPGYMSSSAMYIEDVDEDPCIIVDGLTKNWRLPGFRITWVVAPKGIVEAMMSAGSFLDGGANHVLQEAVKNSNLLDLDFVKEDAKVLQSHFRKKRDFIVKRIEELGMIVEHKPEATFYIWVNVSKLPLAICNGFSFFEKALNHKVICVPGIFFDINPGKRRSLFQSPYHHYIRLSIGPSLDKLKKGLLHFESLINYYRQEEDLEPIHMTPLDEE